MTWQDKLADAAVALLGKRLIVTVQLESPAAGPAPGPGPVPDPGPNPAPNPLPSTGYDLASTGSLLEGFAGLFPSGDSLVGIAGGPIDLANTEGAMPYGLPRADDGVTGSGCCLRWEGALVPPADGLYQFRVAARPGGHVILAGGVAWSDAGQTNGWIWSYFERTLVQGQAYPISALCSASRSGGCGFQLRWRSLAAGIRGEVTDPADVAGYASERGYSDIDAFYLRPPADWKLRRKAPAPPVPVMPDEIPPQPNYATYTSPEVPASFEVYPADNPWNLDLSAAPVHPDSARWKAALNALVPAGELKCHAIFGAGGVGMPFNLVTKNTPRAPVIFDDSPGESDPGPYPMPLAPVLESRGDLSSGADVHYIALGIDDGKEYDIYNLHQRPDGWHAASGAIFDLTSNALRPDGWTSSDAAGTPIYPGLITRQKLREKTKRGVRITVPRTTDSHVPPATHHTTRFPSSDYPPMGARLRLRPDFDTSPFSPAVRQVLEDAKTHPWMVTDNGGPFVGVCGAPDLWDDGQLGELRVGLNSFDFVG